MSYFYQKLEVLMQKENEVVTESVATIISEEEITKQEYDEYVARLKQEAEE